MIPAGIFVEILIVGLFLLLAISPVLFAMWPGLRLQWTSEGNSGVRSEILVIVLLLVYPLGVLGNRFSDDGFEVLIDDTFLELKYLRGEWTKRELQEKLSDRGQIYADLERSEIYKVMEARLLQEDGAVRAWLERHKSFVRMLRGAAFSALLFFLCVSVYKLIPGLPHRYPWKLNLLILVIFLAMFIAWRLETYGYQERVVVLSLYGDL